VALGRICNHALLYLTACTLARVFFDPLTGDHAHNSDGHRANRCVRLYVSVDAAYAGSRNGPIGPLAASSAEKSCSPAVPSLKVACRRWPPRYLSLVTSIIIEFC
jgi:hypothetical protein